MAERKPEVADNEQPAPRKKTKLLLIIGIAVLVVVLVGGGATFLLMKKKADQAAEDGDGTAQEAATKSRKDEPPVFVKLDPFTVKLQAGDGQQESYLQTTPELRVQDPAAGEKIKQYMPEIRYRFLLILTAKKASDVAAPQGVQQLSNEMRDAANDIVGESKRKTKAAGTPPADKAGPDDPVRAVLFTSFIVQ
jgi:flagellar FliL protein